MKERETGRASTDYNGRSKRVVCGERRQKEGRTTQDINFHQVERGRGWSRLWNSAGVACIWLAHPGPRGRGEGERRRLVDETEECRASGMVQAFVLPRAGCSLSDCQRPEGEGGLSRDEGDKDGDPYQKPLGTLGYAH